MNKENDITSEEIGKLYEKLKKKAEDFRIEKILPLYEILLK